MKAQKTASGKWRVQIYLGKDENGKKRKKSITASKKSEAEALAREYLLDYKEDKEGTRNLTLEEACKEYIEIKDDGREASTISGYQTIVENSFQDLMKMPVKKITREQMQKAINEEGKRDCKRKTGKRIARKTLMNEFGFIRSVLRYYRNPEIVGFTADYPKDLEGSSKEGQVLPTAKSIYDAVIATDDDALILAVLLALYCSLRQAEIRGLTKSKSLDKDDPNLLHIVETVVTVKGEHIRKPRAKTSKSKRTVMIPDVIKNRIDLVEGDILVPLTRGQIYKRFIKAQEQADIYPTIAFHDLRALSATSAMLSGVEKRYIEDLGGWANGSRILDRVYIRTIEGEKEKAFNLINDYINKELELDM